MLAVGWLLVATACGGGGRGPDASGAATTAPPAPGPSGDLAPSQITGETVAPPEIPSPCEPDTLTMWTAQVHLGEDAADAVIRVRNDGDVWCEVDVSASPSVDPAMEPDVWLDPGAWADLVVGSPTTGCDAPTIDTHIRVDINGAEVVVETVAVTCGWWLTAFYPNDFADEPCDDLDAAVVDGAIVVRNAGFLPCGLGSLVSVAGEDASTTPTEGAREAASGAEVAVPVLAGGDVVAFELEQRGDDGPSRPVELGFDSGAVVRVALAGSAVSIAAGSPHPWIGGPGSPTGNDPATLLAALDPFGDRP